MNDKRKTFSACICAMLLMAGQAGAQRTPMEKYPQIPSVFYMTFLDHVRYYPVYCVTTGTGQYIGQANDDSLLYGFGSYTDESGQKVGFFRDGAYEFGISMTPTSALVGSTTEYVAYSLSTGHIEYQVRGGKRVDSKPSSAADYAFVNMSYANGDCYIGETYQRRRHGFGIYFYAKGGFWFGQYDGDMCQGPGCLFRSDNTMRIGWYEGGYEKQATEVMPRPKSK